MGRWFESWRLSQRFPVQQLANGSPMSKPILVRNGSNLWLPGAHQPAES
jgi:hypothetical protein